MMELTCFPMAGGEEVDLTEEIGDNYYKFCIHLLEDKTGGQISAMEKELGKNAHDINKKIFKLWLEGKGVKPVSWSTLITVLRRIKLITLASDIEKVKLCG